MAALEALRGWTTTQKHVVLASYLGWMLDAFDFFLLVFVLKDVAKEFGVDREKGDQAWCEGGCEAKHRIECNICHQRGPPAEVVREPPEQERSNWTQCQG